MNAQTKDTEFDLDLGPEVSRFEARLAALPLQVALNDHSHEEPRFNTFFAAWPYLTGEYPFHRGEKFSPMPAHDVLPQRAVIVRQSIGVAYRDRLIVGPGYVAKITQWPSSAQLFVTVAARTDAIAEAVLAELAAHKIEPSPDPHAIDVTFTYCASHGADRTVRRIEVPLWSEIRGNYVAPVRTAVEDLMGVTPDQGLGGRLILLHGPPGTGKTTLIRALATAWREWCAVELVIDPDELFARPSYMFEVMLGGDDDDKRWTLFVLEDCGELLRADARGQPLSRLLNIADGVVGQSRRVLICITTNEPIGHLHPAVVRPGRCLATVEVRAFAPAEAAEWLGEGNIPREEMTLAELYAARSGEMIAVSDNRSLAGYL